MKSNAKKHRRASGFFGASLFCDRCGRLALVAGLLAASNVSAHTLGRSYASICREQGTFTGFLRFDTSDLAAPLFGGKSHDPSSPPRAPLSSADRRALQALAQSALAVSVAGTPCSQVVHLGPWSRTGMVTATMELHCDGNGLLEVRVPLIKEMKAGHMTFLTVREPEGVVFSPVLTDRDPSWHEPREASVAGTSARFFSLGVEHIWTGYDHLLFLFALLLIPATLKELATIVTTFTVAHSITLITAALDWVSFNPRWVEPAIAASIVFVSVQNLIVDKPRRRWVLTFLIGLVHGLGFASSLKEAGLPQAGRIFSLLSFNVGVEIGQMVIVLLVVAALAVLQKEELSFRQKGLVLVEAAVGGVLLGTLIPWVGIAVGTCLGAAVFLVPRAGYYRTVVRGGSSLIGLAGLVWLVERIL